MLVRDGQVMDVTLLHTSGTLLERPLGIGRNYRSCHDLFDAGFCRVAVGANDLVADVGRGDDPKLAGFLGSEIDDDAVDPRLRIRVKAYETLLS